MSWRTHRCAPSSGASCRPPASPQSAARQIERARYATLLLKRGDSIAAATHDAGYFDQPHLTRSLKRLIGQTPAELLRNGSELSYLYKTEPFATP